MITETSKRKGGHKARPQRLLHRRLIALKFRILMGNIGQFHNIIHTDMIIFRDFNQHRNRDLPYSPFISGVNLPVAQQHIRNFLLGFISVNPQISDSLKIHIKHLLTMGTLLNITVKNANIIQYFFRTKKVLISKVENDYVQ